MPSRNPQFPIRRSLLNSGNSWRMRRSKYERTVFQRSRRLGTWPLKKQAHWMTSSSVSMASSYSYSSRSRASRASFARRFFSSYCARDCARELLRVEEVRGDGDVDGVGKRAPLRRRVVGEVEHARAHLRAAVPGPVERAAAAMELAAAE